MSDYGPDIQFGYLLSPDAADAQAFEGQVGEHLGPMLGRPHDPPVSVNGSQPAARN